MTTPAPAPAPSPWPYPFWIAHRGAGKLAPENTLAAFRHGAAHGWRAFECDVKLSADGVPFLLHDATLERTTSGAGMAGDLTWSELSRLDAGRWHGPRWAGEPLASLEALAAFVQANRYAIDIEIKPTPGTDASTGHAVAAAVRRMWRTDTTAPRTIRNAAIDGTDVIDGTNVIEGGRPAAGRYVAPTGASVPLLSSFRPAALAAARDAAAELPRALLVDEPRDGWVEQALELGCVAAITNYRMMSPQTIDRLHASGLRALVYTVNDPALATSLIDAGVDGIVTDAIDRFVPAMEPLARS